MRKGFQLASLAGALSLMFGGAATAANGTLTFGGWDVADGEIGFGQATVCNQAGWSCDVVASGKGFKQLSVSTDTSTADGETYVMTIVTDQNATSGTDVAGLGFYDVSFVKMKLTLGGTGQGSNENGIKSQQRISETGAGKSFTSTTDINTGWSLANTPVAISQTLKDTNGDNATTGDDFESGFSYRSENDAVTGARTGFEMSIDQIAGLASPNAANSDSDVQVFALRERAGTMLSSSSAGTAIPITWDGSVDPKDDIKAIWIGQTINLDSTVGGTSGSLGSSFGYLSFQNTNDAATGVQSEFGFAASNAESAWNWDAAFNFTGPEAGQVLGTPCLADASGVDRSTTAGCGPELFQ